jgi:hypothetical protein
MAYAVTAYMHLPVPSDPARLAQAWQGHLAARYERWSEISRNLPKLRAFLRGHSPKNIRAKKCYCGRVSVKGQ